MRKGYVIFFLSLCELNNIIYAKFAHFLRLFVITLFRAEQYSTALTFHVPHFYPMSLIFLSILGQFQPVPVATALQYDLRLGMNLRLFLLLRLSGSTWSFLLFSTHIKKILVLSQSIKSVGDFGRMTIFTTLSLPVLEQLFQVQHPKTSSWVISYYSTLKFARQASFISLV